MLKILLRLSLCWGILLFPSFLSFAQSQKPEEILWRAHQAELHTSYSGIRRTVTFFRNKRIETTMKILHQYPNRERMEYLNSPLTGHITGCDGAYNWRFEPKRKKVMFWKEEGGCKGNEERFNLLLRNYQVELRGEGKVTGRKTHLLLLKPKYHQNPGKRLWVDAESYLVMASEDYDCRGRLAARSFFETIDLFPHFELEDFDFPKGDDIRLVEVSLGKKMTREELSRLVGFEVLLPTYLPLGYVLEGFYFYRCPHGCGMGSAQLKYINGLNSISIFETDPQSCGCATPEGCGKVGKKYKEAMCFLTDYGQGRMISHFNTKPYIVVLSDLPEKELYRISTSIRGR